MYFKKLDLWVFKKIKKKIYIYILNVLKKLSLSEMSISNPFCVLQ